MILTREVLPTLAKNAHWVIRLDHCFMRVCLDNAVGQRWDEVVRRPATRHLTDAQLASAVALAEAIARDPALLPGLNHRSLQMRGVRKPS